MSNQRTLRNYAAGAAIIFGIVLFTFQLITLILLMLGKAQEDIPALDIIYILVHIIGGVLGSYLVARRVEEDHLQVGVVTVVMAYLFEAIYSLIFGQTLLTDMYVLGSLIIGGLIGAILAKSWRIKQGLDIKDTKIITKKD